MDVSGCGTAGRESYMVSLTVDTPSAAIYATMLNTMRAQVFADQTGNTGDFEDLPGTGTGLAGVTELRSAQGDPVYICGRPQVQVATQIIVPAPSSPPNPPPPAPPTLPFTVTGTLGAFHRQPKQQRGVLDPLRRRVPRRGRQDRGRARCRCRVCRAAPTRTTPPSTR